MTQPGQPVVDALALLTQIMADLHRSAPWFWPMVGGAYGAVAGSFATCALYRVPRKLSLHQPGSYCPHCQTTLCWKDLIPLLSWLLLRGKCRYCGAGIPFRSLWVEITGTGLGVGLFYVAGPTLWFFPVLLVGLGLSVVLLLLGQALLMRFSHTR